MFVLTEDNGGKPAGKAFLDNWVKSYNINYLAVVDNPKKKFFGGFAEQSMPQYLLVDLRTMTILKMVPGTAPASFWTFLQTKVDQANSGQ